MTERSEFTIRPTPDLRRRIRALADVDQESVNATILRLLERVLGVDARRERLMSCATWTEADGREFDQTLLMQRVVDADAFRR